MCWVLEDAKNPYICVMILVTGATGMVGAHILLEIAGKGVAVRALYRTETKIDQTRKLFDLYNKSTEFDKISWVKGDITDLPTLEVAISGCELVYHCAALVDFDPKAEEALQKNNIEGTANVANLCLALGVKILCFISSIATLGEMKKNSFINETAEWNPELSASDYAISKNGAEMEVWRANQEGLNVVVVNPGVIVGPMIWKNGSNEITQKIQQNFPFYTLGTTGFVAVSDVAKIGVALVEQRHYNQRFILVAENLTFQNYFNIWADLLHKKRPNIAVRPLMSSVAWRLDWLVSKLFNVKRTLTKETAQAAHSTSIYSNQLICQTLNYQFTDIKSYLEQIISPS